MQERSRRATRPGTWGKLQLEWEAGLQRLPFYIQRLAVALVGLLVVSLALVGGMVVLWGGQQGSEVQLRTPPEAQEPPAPSGGDLPGPAAPAVGGGAGGGAGAGLAGAVPLAPAAAGGLAGDRTGQPGAGAGGDRGAGVPTSTAPPASTTPSTTTGPTTTGGGLLAPLRLPPELSALLR